MEGESSKEELSATFEMNTTETNSLSAWDFIGLESQDTKSPRRRAKNPTKTSSQNGGPQSPFSLYLFLFHSLLRLTSFLSRNKNHKSLS